MKKIVVLINICFIMCSCSSDHQLSEEDKHQMLTILKQLDENFRPEKEVITYYPFPNMNRWGLTDGSGTDISDKERIESILEDIKDIKERNISTEEYINRLNESFEKNDTANLGMVLTNHRFGDQMIRVLPQRENIDNEYCMEYEWLGDEEYLTMSDEEFKAFLETRMFTISSKRVLFKVPYAEASVTLCDQDEREKYYYNYYFTKSKEGKWLLDDTKIEKGQN